jgi:endonuclease III
MIVHKKEDHLLVQMGKTKFLTPEEKSVYFVKDREANDLLNDLVNFPHAYVLSCCMNRQIKSENASLIPMRLKRIIGDFSIETLNEVSLEKYLKIFNDNSLHRFKDIMAKVFYSAVKRISIDYDGDASKIWTGSPSSASVVYRFLQFNGVGIKIATMAANVLAREFKIPFSDYYSIDISPDVHTLRVMRRSGLVDKEASVDSIIYKARELCPEFPGIIDSPCWEIGRTWCKQRKPICEECIIRSECLKNI